jgi:hypothetical protein
MSAKKTIHVNKSFLELNNRSVKNDKPLNAKRRVSKTLTSTNKMKREFLKKIKDFQNKRNESLKTNSVIEKTPDENEFEQEFSKSLMFLQNIASAKEIKKQDNIVHEISVVLPKSLEQANDIVAPSQSHKTTIRLPPRPLYSCLKNSSRPTYRTWINSQKKQPSVKIQPVIIHDMPAPADTERSAKLSAYKKEKRIVPIKIKKITNTIKRSLGKIGNTVGILIKSRQTRRKIQYEQAKINQTSIHDIKKYLRDRNMIKIGSNSPNNVLRKLYEQCILAGDITNNGENIMLHNFINDKTTES